MQHPHSLLLATRKVYAGAKLFHLDLKENFRGRYIHISEVSGINRVNILIPVESLAEFQDAFRGLGETNDAQEPALMIQQQ